MTQLHIDQFFARAIKLHGTERKEFLASLALSVRSDLEALLECDRSAEELGFMNAVDSPSPGVDPNRETTALYTASDDADTDPFLPNKFSVENESTSLPGNNSTTATKTVLPQQIGRYRIQRLIATGGLGAVYLGEHPNLEELNAEGELVPQRVAIKVGKRKTAVAEQEMVKREASVLCSMDHEHIARVQDLDFHEGLPHLVMEYVSGGSLRQKSKSSPLEVPEALELVAKVCRAIQYAHEKKILHRDLKPENILVTQQGEPKVIDFGLAALRSAMTDAEKTIPGGTIRYMSPEQARHAKANMLEGVTTPSQIEDVRVDVFSLGAILYELLTEKCLYEFSNGQEGLDMAISCSIDESTLDKPEVPRHIKAACLKALAKDKTGRFRTAGAFADAIAPRTSHRPFPNVIAAAIAIAIVLMIGIKLFTPPGNTPNVAESVVSEEIVFQHFANEGETSDPGLLFENGPARIDDSLRVDSAFSDPVYCYLIALNPDGVVQLCYPESEDDIQDQPIRELHYPALSDEGFFFTDGTGQQMFLLVKSEDPLPAFRDWRKVLGTVAWPSKDSGDWVWNRNRLTAVNTTRGSVAKLKGADRFTSICQRVDQKVGLEVHGISFPIVTR